MTASQNFDSRLFPAGYWANFPSPRVKGISYSESRVGVPTVIVRYADGIDLRDQIEIPEGIQNKVFAEPLWMPPEVKIKFRMSADSLTLRTSRPIDALTRYRLMHRFVMYLGWSSMVSPEALVGIQNLTCDHFEKKHSFERIDWNVVGKKMGESWSYYYHLNKKEWLEKGQYNEIFRIAYQAYSEDCNFDPALTPEEAGQIVESFIRDSSNGATKLVKFASMLYARKALDSLTKKRAFQATGIIVSQLDQTGLELRHLSSFAGFIRHSSEASDGFTLLIACVVGHAIQDKQYDFVFRIMQNVRDFEVDRLMTSRIYDPVKKCSEGYCAPALASLDPHMRAVHLALAVLPEEAKIELRKTIEAKTPDDIHTPRLGEIVQYALGVPSCEDVEYRQHLQGELQKYTPTDPAKFDRQKEWLSTVLKIAPQ